MSNDFRYRERAGTAKAAQILQAHVRMRDHDDCVAANLEVKNSSFSFWDRLKPEL
jgi:hypothetical protein